MMFCRYDLDTMDYFTNIVVFDDICLAVDDFDVALTLSFLGGHRFGHGDVLGSI